MVAYTLQTILTILFGPAYRMIYLLASQRSRKKVPAGTDAPFFSLVKELLEKEGGVSGEHILTEHCLIFAARMGHAIIANSLLGKGAEPVVKDDKGFTPLHWAAQRGDEEMVRLFVEKARGLVDEVNRVQQTALCLAVLNDKGVAVEELLASDACPNIPDGVGQTVLHHAASKGSYEIAQILITQNADPHVRDRNRKKAWQLAAEGGYHQIVRLLFGKEIDLGPHSQSLESLFLTWLRVASSRWFNCFLNKKWT